LIFCTDNFSHNDVYRLMNVLQQKFKFNCRIERKENNLRIVVKSNSIYKIQFLVQHHIHPLMMYKLGLSNNQLLAIQSPNKL